MDANMARFIENEQIKAYCCFLGHLNWPITN